MGRDCSRLIANCNACSFPHSPQLISPGVHIYEKLQISARFPRRGVKFEKQSKHAERQSYNFRAFHIALATLIVAVSLQLMQNSFEQFIPLSSRAGNQAEVFIWQKFSARSLPRSRWKHRDLGNRASPPSHLNTTKILLKGFRGKARSRKPNQPSQVGLLKRP